MLGVDDQIQLVLESVGWSTCRGLGYRARTRLWGALARWHFWMRAILWRRMGGCVHQTSSVRFNLMRNIFKVDSTAYRKSGELSPRLPLSHPFPLTPCAAWLGCSYFCRLLYNSIYCTFPLAVRGCLCSCVSSFWDASTVGLCGFSKLKSEMSQFVSVWKNILGSNSQHCMMSTFFLRAEWRMKGKNSWIDHWYPSIHILLVLWDMTAHHWLSWRPWWRDWIILQSSSSVNYRSLFCRAGGGVKGGGGGS